MTRRLVGPVRLAAVLAALAPPALAVTPPTPSQPTPSCDATVSGKCYVNGAFTISSFSSGAHHYRVCRSNDTTGWGGCNAVMTSNTGSSYTVSGSHLPSDGYRRAYYFSACDSANNCTPWSANPESYVYMDTSGPGAPGASTVSCAATAPGECWVTGSFTVSVSPASDGGSGVASYQICRSHDSTGGFAGCQYNMSLAGGTSFWVSGSNLPSDGYRRSYWFRAQDRVGNWGAWNSPRYVRVDRYAPTVSATGSSASWFTSRTATVQASDAVGGAGANSGLSQVRYRWNAAHNGSCTTGTVTSSGATLTAPEGNNTLYLCARDLTGRVSQWTGTYRVDSAPPTAPGPTTVSCAYSTTSPGECWVTGDFTISVTAATDGGSGIAGYQICRSHDSTGGFAGCQYNLSLNGGTSFLVSGSNLPSDGYRRSYWFRAKDQVGNWGAWNSPRYVRVDRHAPTVSATNSSTAWFTSRTATISAADATGGAAANTGLSQVRYRWNAAHNGACTTGTATSSGATLTVPEGDNRLYLCAKDLAGRVSQWSGIYRVDTGPPTAPGPTTVSCAYTTTSPNECWVTGSFTISVTPATDSGSGIAGYQICRSHDSSGGFAGCQYNLSLNGGTSFLVSGSNLPGDGFRRSYWFRAKDNSGTWGPWNTPRYVRVDRHAPTVSATNSSTAWFTSRTATISAADTIAGAAANSGLAQVRYRWNAATNGACSNGTATSSGTTLTVPEGDNTLYLCARDNTGRVRQWSGTYRVDNGPPTAPGPTTVSCAYATASPNECWVTGNFTISVTPATDGGSGISGYQICRSHDSSGGFAGCQFNLSLAGGTSFLVSGSNLPGDGFRRSYWFRAQDNNGNWGPWNTPRYVRIDRYSPTVSATNSSTAWFTSRTATVSAADDTGGAGVDSGLDQVRYRWNAATNGACTNGTATTSGATLTVPQGDNRLYLCAKDRTGRVTAWNGPYRVDATAPVRDSLTVSSQAWSIADGSTYQITLRATDALSGLRELRALINYQGSNSANRRGYFSWRDASLGYLWTADRVACGGAGGFASKHPSAYGFDTIQLVGCTTSVSGSQRTVVFTVKPLPTFGEFGAINDISFWARDFQLNATGWANYDLNFSSFVNTIPPQLVVSNGANPPLDHDDTLSWGEVEFDSGTIGKNMVVRNGAGSGASNLVLEHSPSNVEVVNTQGNAFTWAGALDSPLAPGASDNFPVRLSTTQAGTFRADLKIWHNDPAHPNPLRIRLVGTVLPPPPVVTAVERDPVLRGQVKIIIVRGTDLQNGSVHIGTEPVDPEAPPRVYPSAELVTINSDGTRMEVRIDATTPGLDGFYNLGIETPSGTTAAQFRIIGPEPVIDMWTPSEPVAGRVHVLQVAGINLQGAQVTPMTAGVMILDLDNTDDRSLSGLMFVSSGVDPGDIDVRIDGPGGSVMLEMSVVGDETEATKALHKIDTTGAAPDRPTPQIYLQDPVSPHSASQLLARGYGDAVDLPKSLSAAERDQALKNHICLTISLQARFSFSAILLALTDSLGDPLTQEAVNALLPGQRLDFSSLTVTVSGFIELDFFFRVCETGVTDLRFCIRGGITIMVPAIGGWSIGFDVCFNFNQQTPLPANGRINSHTWNTTNNCVRANDLDPPSIEGERQNELVMDCCADATIGLQTSGVVFEQTFDVGGPVFDVMPANCTPPSGDFRVFLDVDDDNNFDPNNAVPIDQLDDLDDYVPGSRLDGSSIGNLATSPQQMKLVAAFVDVQGNNAQVVPPPSGVTDVEFVLTGTSAFVGVASNWPVSGGSTAPDFHLGSGTDRMTVAFAGDHTARVDFVANDYGAITMVEASPDGGATRQVFRVPKDDDSNMLPDAGWKLFNGTSVSSSGLTASADNDSVPAATAANPTNGRAGDGLSVYEEYRGFLVRGQHRRTNPTVKDVFISSDLATGLAYAFPNLPTATHRVNASDYDSMRDINFNDTNSGAGGAVPGHSLQKAIRGLNATTTTPCLYGQAFTTTSLPATPNETLRVEVYTAQHSAACGIPAAQANNEISRSFGHEVGHALHICHRPGTCPDGNAVGTGASIMSSPVFLGANAQGDPASQYNGLDQAQIRLHINP